VMSHCQTIEWYERRMGRSAGNVYLIPLRSLLRWSWGGRTRECRTCAGVGLELRLMYEDRPESLFPVPCRACKGLGYLAVM
jgi:hypothetical protein